MTPPPSSKTFKLKAFPTAERGRQRLFIGTVSLMMALFNLALIPTEGLVALLFTLLFGWSGSRNVLSGLRMRALPDHARAIKVNVTGLYKVIEGRDVARLPLKSVKALWKNQAGDQLWLCTMKGLQGFNPSELQNEAEWPQFIEQLERCLSHSLWETGEDTWRLVRQQSHQLKALQERPTPVSSRLSLLYLLTLPLSLWFVFQGAPPEAMIAGYPELTFALSGGSASWLLEGLEWSRLLVAPWLHADLLQLALSLATFWWVGRPLERAIGSQRLAFLALGALALSGITHAALSIQAPLLGSSAPQLAMLLCLWSMSARQPARLAEILGARPGALLWLTLAHVFVLSFSPPQLSDVVSVDLITGAVFGSMLKSAWELRAPLWRPRPDRTLLTGFMVKALISLSVVSLGAYLTSAQRPLEERVQTLFERAPSTPTWRAHLASLCSSGAPCDEQAVRALRQGLERDHLASPLSAHSSLSTRQVHLSLLKLKLDEASAQGELSPETFSFMSTLMLTNLKGPYVPLALSWLSGAPSAPLSYQLSQLGLQPSASEGPSARQVPRFIKALPKHTITTLNACSTPTSARFELSSLLTPSPQGLMKLNLISECDARGGRLSWESAWSQKDSAQKDSAQKDSAQKDSPGARLERLWLLVGVGEGEDAQPYALISLPLSEQALTKEELLRALPSPTQPTALWLSPLGRLAQPSSSDVRGMVVWRLPNARQPNTSTSSLSE